MCQCRCVCTYIFICMPGSQHSALFLLSAGCHARQLCVSPRPGCFEFDTPAVVERDVTSAGAQTSRALHSTHTDTAAVASEEQQGVRCSTPGCGEVIRLSYISVLCEVTVLHRSPCSDMTPEPAERPTTEHTHNTNSQTHTINCARNNILRILGTCTYPLPPSLAKQVASGMH